MFRRLKGDGDIWGPWPTGNSVPYVTRHPPPIPCPPLSYGSAGPVRVNDEDDDECSINPAEIAWNPPPPKKKKKQFGLIVKSDTDQENAKGQLLESGSEPL